MPGPEVGICPFAHLNGHNTGVGSLDAALGDPDASPPLALGDLLGGEDVQHHLSRTTRLEEGWGQGEERCPPSHFAKTLRKLGGQACQTL